MAQKTFFPFSINAIIFAGGKIDFPGSVCVDRKWFGETSLGMAVHFQFCLAASDLSIVCCLGHCFSTTN